MQNYPLLYKMRELIKLSHLYLSHAPKSEKYASVQKIKQLEWDVYLLIVEVLKRYHKRTTLTELDVKHEQLRCAWQLYYELGYLAFKDGQNSHDKAYENHRFAAINRQLDEVGAMIGGWIKVEKEAFNNQKI